MLLHDLLTQIRFVQADDIWLSPNYERNSCHITQTIYNPSEEHRQGLLNYGYPGLCVYIRSGSGAYLTYTTLHHIQGV